MKKVSFVMSVFLSLILLSMIFIETDLSAAERVRKIRLSGELRDTAPHSVTIADLEKLTITEFSVMDPYKKEQRTYSGITVRDLVKHYAKDGVKTISIKATDGYEVQFTHSEWLRWDIMLATRLNGKHIPLRESGPARIVMPFDTALDMDKVIYRPKWIWLVSKIEFIK